MNYSAAFLVLFMVLLSTSQGTEDNHRAYNLCKGKKIHNAPFYCKQPECSQLCSNLHPHIRGFGSCRSEVCQCLFFCPANKALRRDFIKANHKLSKITPSTSSPSTSSSSSSKKHLIKKP